MAFARGLRRGLRRVLRPGLCRVLCVETPRVAHFIRQGINRTKVSQAKPSQAVSLGEQGVAEHGEQPSGASGFCQFSVAEVIG